MGPLGGDLLRSGSFNGSGQYLPRSNTMARCSLGASQGLGQLRGSCERAPGHVPVPSQHDRHFWATRAAVGG